MLRSQCFMSVFAWFLSLVQVHTTWLMDRPEASLHAQQYYIEESPRVHRAKSYLHADTLDICWVWWRCTLSICIPLHDLGCIDFEMAYIQRIWDVTLQWNEQFMRNASTIWCLRGRDIMLYERDTAKSSIFFLRITASQFNFEFGSLVVNDPYTLIYHLY